MIKPIPYFTIGFLTLFPSIIGGIIGHELINWSIVEANGLKATIYLGNHPGTNCPWNCSATNQSTLAITQSSPSVVLGQSVNLTSHPSGAGQKLEGFKMFTTQSLIRLDVLSWENV